MHTKLKIILFWFFLTTNSFANVYFIFDTAQDRGEIERSMNSLNGKLLVSLKMTDLVNQTDFKMFIKKVDDYYILRSNTLPSTDKTAVLYLELKKLYPRLYFIERGSSANTIQHTKIITVEKPVTVQENSDFTIWIALFGLAIIGILALSLSSFQVQSLMKKHKEIRKKHEEMELRINEMFSIMGENIHRLSKDIVQYTNNMIKETNSHPIKNKLKRVVNAENRILDSATNLLDFLYLKAKKIKVKKEHFNINNALDDMLESLVKNVSRDDVELIFYIDKSMPKFIVGDFLHIGEVFGKILEHTIVMATSKDIKVKFSSNTITHSNGLELKAEIIYSSVTDVDDINNFFIPVYNENIAQYERLGLYVAHELIRLMEGHCFIEYDDKNSIYKLNISIPVEESPDKDKRKYNLLTKNYIQRDILIINRNYESSLALKGLFTNFKHRVKVLTAEKFMSEEIDFSDFDILMIDEKLINENFSNRVKFYRNKLKIVGLESIFTPFSPNPYRGVIDIRSTRPMSQEKAWNLIENLYIKNARPQEKETIIDNDDSKRKFQANILETKDVNLHSFADFKGRKIMVVEDNQLNVKMLLKVLEYSGMTIITAKNGKEALGKISRLNEGEIELILMDINMPIMDGYIATKKIRQLPIGEDLPIIALSALSLENEFRRMQESGMDGYIPKPLNIGQLYTVFEIFLKKDSRKKKNKTKKIIPKLEGIDLKLALENVSGNEILLKEILSEFINVYGDSGDEMERLYKDKRFEQLKQYLFDLVGLASTIGAKDLAAYAQEMRKLYIYNKMDAFPSYLKKYTKALKVVKKSLNNYLNI